MISSGQKTGGRATNLRKKRKTNGLVGAKNRGGMGQHKEKEKMNGSVGA